MTGSEEFAIFILDSDTAKAARKTVDAYLKATGTDPVDSETGRFMVKDGYNGTIFLSWKDTRIVIISGLSKDQSDLADKYTSEILK